MSALTQARLHELLHYDPDTGIFTRRVSRPGPNGRVGAVAGCDNGQGYIRIYVDGAPHKAHRLAWLYVHGVWPAEDMDHKNLNRADNRLANLREATRAENANNRRAFKNNVVGVKGVSPFRGKWKAQIQVNGKKLGLGYFDSIDAAAAAYRKAALVHHRSFARVA